MPSNSIDSAEFTEVDWEAESSGRFRPRLRTVGFVLALLVLAGMLMYDYTAKPDELIWFMNWDVTRMDWLSMVSAVLFARYAVVPLLTNRERSAKYVKAFLTRPAGALSSLVILFFVFFGLVGPEFVDFSFPRLSDRLQPPVYSSVYVGDMSTHECVGKMAGEFCQGTWKYPLGTNSVGEDLLEPLFYGNRTALKLGLSVAAIMAVIATAVGTTAGYFGGRVDDVLMRYVEIQQTVPAIVVYLIVATVFLGNISGLPDGGLFTLALVFGLLDWGGIARIVRSEVLARRTKGYVRAAKAAGASDLHVIRRHIVPNSTATLVTSVTRRIPLLILAQVALAFLELNRVDERSIGGMLRSGLSGQYMVWHRKWWVTTFGVVFLVLVVVSFNVFGDTARDVLDPQEGVE
jgi:peptide/nickel transport system permease protein